MINFTRAFDSAWERMVIILFRPFDLGKWCLIGFCAFLAGLLRGGNGVNFSYRQNFSPQTNFHWQYRNGTTGSAHLSGFPQNVLTYFGSLQFGLAALVVSVAMVFILGFIVLIYWLGARGEFMLLDNITRNRGAVSEPWIRYSRPANRAFLFHLFYSLISFGLALFVVIPAVVLAWPLFRHPHWPDGFQLLGLVVLGLVYLVFCIVAGIGMFLFHEWSVPLMFRNDLSPRAAFVEVLRLIQNYPGQVTLFLLLRLALFIGLAIVSLLACCFTCCLAALPYVGTIVLLPVIVYTRCFTLDCLAQFGPSYEVWTVDVPPAGPAATNLPLPLG